MRSKGNCALGQIPPAIREDTPGVRERHATSGEGSVTSRQGTWMPSGIREVGSGRHALPLSKGRDTTSKRGVRPRERKGRTFEWIDAPSGRVVLACSMPRAGLARPATWTHQCADRATPRSGWIRELARKFFFSTSAGAGRTGISTSQACILTTCLWNAGQFTLTSVFGTSETVKSPAFDHILAIQTRRSIPHDFVCFSPMFWRLDELHVSEVHYVELHRRKG